jgi:hypothetical protein
MRSFAGNQLIGSASLGSRKRLWKNLRQSRSKIRQISHAFRSCVSADRVRAAISAAYLYCALTIAFVQDHARPTIKIPDSKALHVGQNVGKAQSGQASGIAGAMTRNTSNESQEPNIQP